MKLFFILLILSAVGLSSANISFAESSYTLPYPSAMPGNIFYKIHVLLEKILPIWYFGNLGQFTYNLKEADIYLVEAKTLIEYQQYLLGDTALQKSNIYFAKIYPALEKAQREGKNIINQEILFQEAIQKHREVLETLEKEVPSTITWNPERGNPTTINFQKSFQDALAIRKL